MDARHGLRVARCIDLAEQTPVVRPDVIFQKEPDDGTARILGAPGFGGQGSRCDERYAESRKIEGRGLGGAPGGVRLPKTPKQRAAGRFCRQMGGRVAPELRLNG